MRRKSPARTSRASAKSARRSASPAAKAKVTSGNATAKEDVHEGSAQVSQHLTRENVLACFQRFDINKNGIIEPAELAELLQDIDRSVWTRRRVDQLLSAVDTNMDGQIDYEEFLTWVFKDSPRDATGMLFMNAIQGCIDKAPDASAKFAIDKTKQPASEHPHATAEVEPAISAEGTFDGDLWTAAVDEVVDYLDDAVLPLQEDKRRRSGTTTFHCILEAGLYLGGANVSADDLHDVGITHIVRVLEDTTYYVLPKDEVRGIFSVQVADVQRSDLRPFFSGMHGFVAEALGHGGKVYVHCAQGRSRSCTMVLSYLIAQEKMSLRSAWLHVLQRRDVSAINLGFLAQLVDLDEAVHGRQSLPLLSAFIAKTRWNNTVLKDKSRKFDVSELLELWRDHTAITRDLTAGLAIVNIKASILSLRKFLVGNPDPEEGETLEADLGISLEPLRTACCTELYNQLNMLTGVSA